jgi:hypothetical protein
MSSPERLLEFVATKVGEPDRGRCSSCGREFAARPTPEDPDTIRKIMTEYVKHTCGTFRQVG